jgi:hypothetical protein
MSVDAQTVAEVHATTERPRNAHTPCAWPGCTRTPAEGHVLVRVNPKGEPGIFMCRDDAAVWAGEAHPEPDRPVGFRRQEQP